MKSLTDLFKLVQITRDQPQYGYNLAGIHKHELSDLAQHHYLVTFITWQLGRLAERAGGKIYTARAMEISMIHDLGELFGSDISHYYAKANPEARALAKNFEHANNEFLSNFFDEEKDYYMKLVREMEQVKSDESKLAKIADYVEVLHYKQHLGKLGEDDLRSFLSGIVTRAQEINDTHARGILTAYLNTLAKQLPAGNALYILQTMHNSAPDLNTVSIRDEKQTAGESLPMDRRFVAYKGVVIDSKARRLLAIRYSNHNWVNKKVRGRLSLPGGKTNPLHNPEARFIQRVKEETGITIKPKLPFYSWSWSYTRNNTTNHIMALAHLSEYVSGNIANPIKRGEVDLEKALWLPLDKLDVRSFLEEEQPMLKRLQQHIEQNPFQLV